MNSLELEIIDFTEKMKQLKKFDKINYLKILVVMKSLQIKKES